MFEEQSSNLGAEPSLLASSLERYFRNLGAPPVNVLSKLVEEWESIVGPALSGVTTPVKLLDGTLVVRCDDPAWASQISWMESQIKDRFLEKFAPTEILKIQTRIS